MERGGFESPDEVVRTALAALDANTRQFWQRIKQLDAEAGEDDEAGYHPVTDEFIARLRSIVTPACN